jgi:hypothetical protein
MCSYIRMNSYIVLIVSLLYILYYSHPPTTYHLPPTTYHLPPTTYHLPPYHLPPTTYRLPPTTYRLPPTTYHLPPTIHRLASRFDFDDVMSETGRYTYMYVYYTIMYVCIILICTLY